MAIARGTADDPRLPKTPPLTAAFTMHRDTIDGTEMLICTIGKTALHYEYRCVKDSASAMARMEVSGGKVGRVRADEPEPGRQCLWQL